MLFQWIVGLISILALIFVLYSDRFTGKSKHSNYFETVQKPLGKGIRNANIPDSSKHDSFFFKLNEQ